MTVKNILVATNGTKGSDAALTLAVMLAKKYEAHLTGILVHGLPQIAYSYGSYLSPVVLQEFDEADKEYRAAIKRSFDIATSDLKADNVHFIETTGETDFKIMRHACAFDVIFAGSPDDGEGHPHMAVHPDVLARESGRPVLMVPSGYHTEELAPEFLLAWDGKRSAASAASEAIRLFSTKGRKIHVLTVGGESPDSDPIMQHLERHGCAPVLHHKPKASGGIAETILASAEETGAGLIIMGAYEHAKFAEDLFGGVTNSIMSKAGVPVLLSH